MSIAFVVSLMGLTSVPRMRKPFPSSAGDVAVDRRLVLRSCAGAVSLPAALAGAAERTPSTDAIAQYKESLSPSQFHILFEQGTEPPWSSSLVEEKRSGLYRCAACGTPLFSSSAKFNSNTGWPSFYEKLNSVRRASDIPFVWSLVGTEVFCANCKGHLGHLFGDGVLWQTPTGLRYCIDGLALDFEPAPSQARG